MQIGTYPYLKETFEFGNIKCQPCS